MKCSLGIMFENGYKFLSLDYKTRNDIRGILAWLEECQEPPCHHQWLGGHRRFMSEEKEDIGDHWQNICSSYVIPDPSAKHP